MKDIGESAQVGRNTAYLTGAQLFSQVSSAIYVAVLARYVLAEGMGKLAIAQAVTGIAFVFVNLGLDTLTVRDVAQDPGRTNSYLSGSIWLKAGLSALVCMGLVLFARVAGYASDLQLILYLYALGTTLRCFTSSIVSIWQAHEFMRVISWLRVWRDVVNVVGSLVAIALGASLAMIVGVSVLANVVELIVALMIKPLPLRFHLRVKLVLLRDLFVRNIPFAGLAIVGILYAQFAILVLSFRLDQASVGYYSSALILLNFFFIVPAMLSQALLPTLSRLNVTAQRTLAEAYTNAYRLTWVGGAFLTIVTLFMSRPIIVTIFGNKYDSAIPVLQVIGICLLFSPSYISGTLLNATNRQTLFTISQAVLLLLQLVLVLLLVPELGLLGASVAFVVPALIGFIYYTAVCHRLLGVGFSWKLAFRLCLTVGLTVCTLFLSNEFGSRWFIAGPVCASIVFLLVSVAVRILVPADGIIAIRLLLPQKLLSFSMRFLPSHWSS